MRYVILLMMNEIVLYLGYVFSSYGIRCYEGRVSAGNSVERWESYLAVIFAIRSRWRD